MRPADQRWRRPRPFGEAPTDQLASLIGFSADDLRGTLTIVAPLDLMRESYPLPLSTDDSSKIELFDWSGEIANRLMGRIKCTLIRYGVDVLPSSPKVMWADSAARPSPRTICDLRFSVGGARVGVQVDAIASNGHALLQGALANDESLDEGEVVLF